MHGERVARCGRRTLLALAVAGAIGVSGCSGGDAPTPAPGSSSTTATVSAPTPSPSSSLTPQQQAAEEAKAAYADYRKTLDAVFQRGGTNAREDLAKVATNGQLTFLLDEAAQFASQHVRQVGSATVKSVRVHDIYLKKSKLPQVLLRVCTDATTEDAVDRSGRSVRKPGALAHFMELVTLTRFGGTRWLVSQEDDTPVESC